MVNKLVLTIIEYFFDVRIFVIVIFLGSVNLIYSQSITVTSPVSGAVLNGGSSYDITWDYIGSSTNVDIQYSSNGGLNWDPVQTGIAATDGSFSWSPIPNIPTTQALIKITGVDFEDISDPYFFIKSPQSFGNPVKILPLGNSITYDQMRAEFRFAQDKISYRYFLWDNLRTNNYNIDFIGHKLGGYYQFPDPENNGVPGIHDDELLLLLNSGYDYITQTQVTPDNYLNTYPPDVVLLHIGINGITDVVLGNDTVGTNPNEVADILTLIKTLNPDIWVILALIMDGAPNIPNVTLFNNNIKQMAQTRINAGDKILIVDMQNDANLVYTIDTSAPFSGDMYDGIHPNDSGKEKMANLWFQALQLILPNPATANPVITSTEVTTAYVGLPYRYDVDASGVGAPNYSLTSPPAGMAINSKTGIIDWPNPSGSSADVSVTATHPTNSTTSTQNFTINVLPAPSLPSNIISYWRMNETGSPTRFEDLPGVNDAYCTECPTVTQGIVGGALFFNGNKKVDVLDDSSLYFDFNESFTIEMWVKPNQSGQQSFIGKWTDPKNTFYSLGMNSENKLKFELNDFTYPSSYPDFTSGFVTGTTVLNDGLWHHIAGQFWRKSSATDELKLYVDGNLESLTYKELPSDFFSWDPLTIGYYKNGNFYYNGLMDEVAIYNDVLDDATVLDHYNRGYLYNKGYFDQFVLVKTKIFLEGPYNTPNMNTLLTVPTTSPYSQDPRTVTSIPSNIVDWVLIEARNSTTNPTVVGYRSAFLRNDGYVVGDDGTSDVPVEVTAGSYYIVIRHRNHLAVMSKDGIPVTLSSYPTAATLYDFTTGSGQFYGTGGAKELEPGVWGMIGGDANGDDQVNAVDRNETWNLRNQVGYLIQDVNEDAQVNAVDRNITWNNRNLISLVP